MNVKRTEQIWTRPVQTVDEGWDGEYIAFCDPNEEGTVRMSSKSLRARRSSRRCSPYFRNYCSGRGSSLEINRSNIISSVWYASLSKEMAI
ncbi:MAG: hypothetical protein MOIL_00702 [Candidatus Methanolliviera sp. GoM_oil]|nr:MAG: hypothetical protein MOIL_00702 [Candidatus Methanolliviera sp. GoM_oil]